MPIFTYKALTTTGQEIKAEAAAATAEELRKNLEHKGLLVRGVHQKRVGTTLFNRHRVSAWEFIQCNQELITLLKAGLTLPEALEIISDRPGQNLLSGVYKSVL